MRTALALLALPLVALPALGFFPQRARQDARPGLTAQQEDAKKELEEHLVGVWTLTTYRSQLRTADLQQVAGFAMFQDGYMSIIMQAQAIEPGDLEGDIAFYFQAGTYRYQVSTRRTLQVASMLGFDNMNPEGEIQFIGNRSIREHPIVMNGDEMILSSTEGAQIGFRKLGPTGFPQSAVERIQRNPTGEER